MRPTGAKQNSALYRPVFVLVLTKIKPCVSGLHENMKRNPNKKCKPAYSLKSAHSTAVSHKSAQNAFSRYLQFKCEIIDNYLATDFVCIFGCVYFGSLTCGVLEEQLQQSACNGNGCHEPHGAQSYKRTPRPRKPHRFCVRRRVFVPLRFVCGEGVL